MAAAEEQAQESVGRHVGKAGGLLHSLVPRARSFCFYDLERICCWTSDGGEDFEIDAFIGDLPDELIEGRLSEGEPLHRTLPSGRTVFMMHVPDDAGRIIGLLVALFSKNAGKSASFNPNLLKTILKPALSLVADSILHGFERSGIERRAAEVEKELELIYSMDEKIHGTRTRHSSLAQLVGQSGRFLGIGYSVLLIPSKRIRISATHSTWKDVNRKALDRYLLEHLMPRVEGQYQPLVFDVPPGTRYPEGRPDPGYQALLCPIQDRQGNVEGMLAQLGRADGATFAKNERRFMMHIARKVEYVIEQSFDAMTGFMNRGGFEAQLHESWKGLASDDASHQLIYFDIDNLQLVNDTFGRKAGDDVIMRFARILEDGLPKSAVLSRLTGDDFCMLLTNADVDAALDYAQRIRARGAELRYLQGDRSLQVTVSIGIAAFTRASGDDGAVLTTARMACEAAKDHGRDRIEVYDDQNQSIIRRHDDMQLVASIQQALDGNGFQLLAQPIVDLTGKTRNPRFEVLLRMQDTDGQKVPTSAIFSAAERYRMMPHVDRWVVSRTLARLAPASASIDGLDACFSINLSGQSLGDDDILEFIEEEIRQSGIPASSLCFEITESAAVSNLEKAKAFIERLRELGCAISLDDFGAGLSSFAYLKNFQVDTLKIDGSFIRDITDNRISESMVAAITQVAKVMDLQTVAEYVETDSAKKLLSKLGVHFAQGHALGKPEPIVDVIERLADLTQSASA